MRKAVLLGICIMFGMIMFTKLGFGEIIFLNGGGMIKGQITEKNKETIKVKIKYGEITVARKEIDKIREDADPDAIFELAKFHVSKEEWQDAIEEFDNLLLFKPEKKDEVLNYISDINFSRSPKERLKRLESISQAYKMIEDGKRLANFGRKQLKYKTRFKDVQWQKKLQRIARKNIKRGDALVKKGKAIIDSYHRQRDEEIRRAREKAEQEKQGKK